MKKPFFSIAIPVKNRRFMVEEAISSVLSQTFSDYEIIVVDNNSNDGTWEYLNSLNNSQIKIYQNNNDIGAVRNWAKCVEYTSGEWLRFLMSDDILIPTALELAWTAITQIADRHIGPFVYISNGDLMVEKNINTTDAISSQSNYELVKSIDWLNQVSQYNHSRFTTMPNAYILPRRQLIDLFQSPSYTAVIQSSLGKTGHCVDYFIFAMIAKRAVWIIYDKTITYLVKCHSNQGLRAYYGNLGYRVSGERYINNLIFGSSAKDIIYIIQDCLRTFVLIMREQKNLLARIKLFYSLFVVILSEVLISFRSINPKPVL